MQNLENLGANGDKGVKIASWKCHIWNLRPWLPIHYATFMGPRWQLRVVYSWAPPLLSVFSRKKVPFWANIWQFWGLIRGLTLNLSFLTPKRHILAWFHVYWAELSRVKIHQPVTCVRVIENKVYRKKAQKRHISPICTEAPNEWICTKFGLGGPLADVINFVEIGSGVAIL